jgi:ATP-dependent RNA helicase DHX8/PRP22
LYSEQDFENLDKHRQPEILRTPLHQTILQLKVEKRGDIEFVDSPPNEEIINCTKLLKYLKALDSNGDPTGLGKQLLKLPVSLEMGKALLTSVDYNCSEEMCKIAAMTTVGYFLFKKDSKVWT